MDCPSCGAAAAGNYCATCGTALPEPEVAAEVAELEAEADLANAHAGETYAEAELERAEHATDADVEVVEAVADVAETEAQADVAVAAIDAVADVAVAAIDAVAEAHEEPEPEVEPETELEELGAEELEHHEHEHEAMEHPPQPDDGAEPAEHVEPITLLAPAPSAGATRTTTRSTAWRRHRR